MKIAQPQNKTSNYNGLICDSLICKTDKPGRICTITSSDDYVDFWLNNFWIRNYRRRTIKEIYKPAITGTTWSETKTHKTEHQDISHAIVNGVVVLETEGTITETNESASGYSGEGTWDCPTNGYFSSTGEYSSYVNSQFEYMSISEFYSTSFTEAITAEYSNKLDDDNELVFESEVTAGLNTQTSGSYSFDYSVEVITDYFGCYYLTEDDEVRILNTHTDLLETISLSSDYSSDLTETWTKAIDETTLSLSDRSGEYNDSYAGDYNYEYNYRKVDFSEEEAGDVAYDYQDPLSSDYDDYEIADAQYELSDGFGSDDEKEWDIDDATVETNDYLVDLLESLTDDQTAAVGTWQAGLYGVLLNAYSSVPSFIQSDSNNANFTDNGTKENYAYTTTPATPTNITPPTLEAHNTNDTDITDLTTAEPDCINAVDEMPEPEGEEPTVPETPEPTLPDSSQISNLSYLWEITCAVGDSLTTGAVNIATGAYNTVKELVFTVVDIAMVSADTVGTIAGSPIGWNEWSSQGQSFQDATTLGTMLNAGRAGLGGGTLGMSEIVISTYNYIQDGDADAFQQHLGGVAVANLGVAVMLRGTNFGNSPLKIFPTSLSESALVQLGRSLRSSFSSGTIPKESYPKPPGWTSEWEWAPSTRDNVSQWRWWDPDGGEWHYHFPDKHHPVGHWDYNPWRHPSDQWQNIYPENISQ